MVAAELVPGASRVYTQVAAGQVVTDGGLETEILEFTASSPRPGRYDMNAGDRRVPVR